MNAKTHEHPKKTTMNMSKILFILSIIIAGSFVTSSAYSQVRVDASIGVPVYERDYPGYAYYTYPAWNGHYRDRAYYAHYHRSFERNHRAYLHGRQFDHDRYERENHWHDGHGDEGRH